VADTAYYPEASDVACPNTDSRYCESSKFYNEYRNFDMEFMEGDTPQSMTALWWKEICNRETGASGCPPEKICGAPTGSPWVGNPFEPAVRSTYFVYSDYTFDGEGCYFNHVA
jgi:hypothetical protein